MDDASNKASNDADHHTSPADCILCPDDRARIPRQPPVCDACRSWLAGMLGDIRILTEQLIADPQPVVDVRTTIVLLADGTPAPLLDRVIQAAPAALVPGPPGGPRIRSVPTSRPPLPLEPIDLVLPAHPASRALSARAVLGLDDDQIGHLSVATMLEGWVREVIVARRRGEHRPDPTVDVQTRWLADRLDWACDEYDELPAFAADLRRYRSVLRGVLGLSDRPEYLTGVPCRRCDLRALYRRSGSEWVECGNCPNLLSADEYADWVTRAVEDSPSARQVRADHAAECAAEHTAGHGMGHEAA